MLTLVLLPVALAGPTLTPPPPARAPAGVEVALVAQVGTEAAWRTASGCEGACRARRTTRARGGSLVVRGGSSLWGWVDAAATQETLEGASWNGDGLQGGGGVAGRAAIRGVEVLGWVEGDHARLDGADGPARRTELVLGAALTSAADDSVVGWAGVEGLLTVHDDVGALAGAVPLTLAPTVPLRLVAGGTMTSDPLGGPWSTHGRVLLTARGWAGAGAGFDLGLGGSW